MEYYSFDRVLAELAMGEGELKRLVSEGEIRAFRDEDKMKFKKSDIEGLKKGRMTEPTIILPSGGDDDSELDDESSEVLLVEDDTSETLLDIDELDDDDFESGSSTSVPTVDFSVDSDETGSETLTEELVFDDDSSSAFETEDIASQATFVDDDTGMTTEPIELIDDDDDDDSETMAAPAPQRAARRGAMPAPEAPGNPVMSAVLVFSAMVLLFGGFLVISLIQEEDNSVTGWLTDIVAKWNPIIYFDDEGKQHTYKSDRELQKYVEWRQRNRAGVVPLKVDSPSEGSGEEEGTTGGTN